MNGCEKSVYDIPDRTRRKLVFFGSRVACEFSMLVVGNETERFESVVS